MRAALLHAVLPVLGRAPSASRWTFPLLAALGLLASPRCAPDVSTDPVPIAMEFDSLGDPPRTPEPNGVVINPETGHIDFSILDWWLPTYAEDCVGQPAWPVAACEFNVYLETLDGFPTVSSFRAPVTGSIDLSTAIPGETLIVDSGSAFMAPGIIETLEANGYEAAGVRAVLVTHGHLDHYGGAAALAAWSGAQVWAHLHAASRIEDHWGDFISPGSFAQNVGTEAWEAFRRGAGEEVTVARILREGDTLRHAGMTLAVCHMPGHQQGQVTLFEPERRLAFVGDLVQGGADCSANWLGLFEDVARQRASLERLADLEPNWLFRGHRPPWSGAAVARDIESALARLDALEEAVLKTLRERSPLTSAELARALFREVLGMEVEEPRNYAVLTAAAFLLHLAQRGAVVRDADLRWRLA